MGTSSLEDVLADAQRKDGGADPATLAWVLSDLRIAPTAPIPGGMTAEGLEVFREALVQRLSAPVLPQE